MPRTKKTALKRPANQSLLNFPVAKKTATLPPFHEKAIIDADEYYQNLSPLIKLLSTQITTTKTPTPKIIKKKVTKAPVRKKEKIFSIPQRPFQKLVRELANQDQKEFRFKAEALKALQIATEDFLAGFFEDAQKCAAHAHRKTLMVKDIQLIAKLRKIDYEPI